MSRPPSPSVAGLVLAAGGSSRLGRPKQLLPFGEATLLDHVLGTARACGFDQLLCVLGGGAGEVRATVDLNGVEVVENHSFAEGCSSSIAAAMASVDPRSDVLVLLLGDQPGVTTEITRRLLDRRGDAPLAVCSYADGRGHPFAFSRAMFGDLAALRGDKAMWELLDRHHDVVVDVPIPGPVPRDVDTWEDYDAVLGEAAAG
jgi:molybdenum cofactor cytidylyltransferase